VAKTDKVIKLFLWTHTNVSSINQPKLGDHKNMKNKTNTNLLIKSLSILTALSLTAESTQAGLGDPVGITQVTVPSSTTSVMGTPYARMVEAFGTISGAAASGLDTVLTVVKDPSSPSLPSFANNDINVDQWYIIEVVDGPAIGLILNAKGGAGDTSITVEGLVPSSINIETGSKFAVRKAWTLSSLFGAASASNVFGSGLSSTAVTVNAQVQVLNSATGALTTYFIHASSGGNYNWRASISTANRNHVPIGLGKGFVVVNRKAVPFNFDLAGDYRTARTRIVATAGKKTLLSNPGLFDTTFNAATIPVTSPNKANTVPSASHDAYGIWNTANRTFTTYRIGGVTQTGGASAMTGNTRVNPSIAKFTSVLVTPAGSGDQVVTIAPAYTSDIR